MLNTEWIQKWAEDSTPNTEKVAEAMAGAIINRLRDQMSNFTASHPMGTPVPRAFCVSGFRVYQCRRPRPGDGDHQGEGAVRLNRAGNDPRWWQHLRRRSGPGGG